MQAAMVWWMVGSATVRGTWALGRRIFRRNENRGSMADKFDTDSLSLHVFSIR